MSSAGRSSARSMRRNSYDANRSPTFWTADRAEVPRLKTLIADIRNIVEQRRRGLGREHILWRGRCLRQCGDSHTEQADPSREGHAFQTFAGNAPDRSGILRRCFHRVIARDRLEIVKAKLQADCLADVAFAPQVVAHAFAKLGKDS